MRAKSSFWFETWCLANCMLGVSMVAAAWPPLDLPLVWLMDIIYWPFDGHPGALHKEAKLGAGIAGAVLAGWCLVLHGISRSGLLWERNDVRRYVLIGLIAWFLLDSAQSIGNAAPLNVALNVVVLAGFGLPLRALDGK